MTNWIEREITLADFAKEFLSVTNLTTPAVYDLTGKEIEILSFDVKNNRECFEPILDFIVKEPEETHYKLGELHGTADHKIFRDGVFVSLCDHPDAELIPTMMNVVDLSVHDKHCYIANGHINHNTTPGGVSIPFHASVRLRLSSGTQIKDDKTDEIIGINVIATTKKNKVAPPFRKVNFEIHFGKGIVEHEQLFDIMREKGKVLLNGKQLLVEGASAWKTFTVTDMSTGEVLINEKFYKADFDRLWKNPKMLPHLEDLLEATMVKKMGEESHITVLPPEELDEALEEEARVSGAMAS